jgi:hypothetical protein
VLHVEDRLRHPISGAFARESIAYVIPLPDEGILALLYTWVNGQDEAGYAFAIYEQGPDMAHFRHINGLPAEGRDFDDWQIGDIGVQVGPDFDRARAWYADDEASIDVTFDAIHEPFDYDQNRGGCPEWQATNRYEQSGIIHGTLTWRGRTIEIDAPGHRDHSWGRRDWDALHHYKWLAVAGRDRAANVMVTLVEGETLYHGYVYVDGVVSAVTSADVTTQYDPEFWHERVDAVVHDEAGRATPMRFPERFASGRWDVSPTVNFTDGCFSGDIAGGPVAAYIQYVWPRAYLDYLLERDAAAAGSAHV